MSSRTIKTPSGQELTLSSDDLSQEDLILAEVLLEMCAARGNNVISSDDEDEILQRIRAKGYDPMTYQTIH